uniref:Uncharacterized protein n=1 Tax=Gouania willdenowi TaxID=441366 RepID=A0A8C5DTE8_GOUWI
MVHAHTNTLHTHRHSAHTYKHSWCARAHKHCAHTNTHGARAHKHSAHTQTLCTHIQTLVVHAHTNTLRAHKHCAHIQTLMVHAHTNTCNYCYSKGSNPCTPTSVQTCSGQANACAAVVLPFPLNSSFRQCMNMAVCQGYITTPGVFETQSLPKLTLTPHDQY